MFTFKAFLNLFALRISITAGQPYRGNTAADDSVSGQQTYSKSKFISEEELLTNYEVCSKSKVTLYFYEKLFIYSSIFMLSPSK